MKKRKRLLMTVELKVVIDRWVLAWERKSERLLVAFASALPLRVDQETAVV